MKLKTQNSDQRLWRPRCRELCDRPKLKTPSRVTVWEGKIPMESWYTSGVAGEKTLKALKERGSFLATVCDECGVIYFPARMFCERCFADILGNEKTVGPSGTLESWSIVTVDKDGKKLKKPQVFGLIKLDGANTLFLHKLSISTNSKLKTRISAPGAPSAGSSANGQNSKLPIGARVEPVLKEPAQRRGSVTDILHFQVI